jgi:release factor glutamine methyltransferase
MSTWRDVRTEAARRLADAGVEPADAEARFLVERASGYDADEWLEAMNVKPPLRAENHLWEMVERRSNGEPLQYVLGAWAFRGLDLMVDRRVLIPRPETEIVVEVALEEAELLGLRRARRRLAIVDTSPRKPVVDLGTGSGAIALALEAELPDVDVWATDASDEALAVAAANVAGCAATRVRLAPAGSWFEPLDPSLKGEIRLVVSNPPYVADDEYHLLPGEVREYEPERALVSGPEGFEMIEEVLLYSRDWIAPKATVVIEIAPHQSAKVIQHAQILGYRDVHVRDDLAGRARVLVARWG